MGSDRLIPDVTKNGHALLARDAAERLMAPITSEAVRRIEHLSNVNDVFRIITASGNRYYVKFHTSPWYKDAEDTAIVVQRECLAARILKQNGIPLNYASWADCTRSIVNRSVLITSELPGEPLPRLLQRHESQRSELLSALGQYLGKIHSIAFPVAGYLEFSGDTSIPPNWIPEKDPWWNSHACQTSENLMNLALETLLTKADALPNGVAAEIRTQFCACANDVATEYRQPSFVINNFHPFHFHLSKATGQWEVMGFYDLEVASSGNSTIDIELNDIQVTPLVGQLDWRTAFFAAYDRPVGIQTYKIMLITHLIMELGNAPSLVIPDPKWIIEKLPDIARASTIEELAWYPSGRVAE